ncbi:MAG: hypothetical protein LBR78_02350 [Holosporales bacterium]|jgi:hypothetical protein|nr:hypothetical protein [Holosporales bacterium]
MNKLVLLSSMVMIGTGIVRGGESLRSEETLEREREDRTLSSRYHR